MRLVMTLLLATPALLLCSCDKASAPQGQDTTASAASTDMPDDANAREDIQLESASGMNATLTYAHAGNAAPEVHFTGGDGRNVSLRDFAGRHSLVNIWATWCGPCKAEMPTIDALAEIEAGNLSVVAVSQDLQGRKPVLAFFEGAGIRNLEPYTDKENALLNAYGSSIVLPTTILYDSNGLEVWRVLGGLEWDDEEVAALLLEAA